MYRISERLTKLQLVNYFPKTVNEAVKFRKCLKYSTKLLYLEHSLTSEASQVKDIQASISLLRASFIHIKYIAEYIENNNAYDIGIVGSKATNIYVGTLHRKKEYKGIKININFSANSDLMYNTLRFLVKQKQPKYLYENGLLNCFKECNPNIFGHVQNII